MKAVILAAGVGRRLWSVTQHHPKCLMRWGGHPLLTWYMHALSEVGVKRVAIVIGYKQEMIRQTIESQHFPMEVHYVINDEYERGSVGSLWAARHEFDDDAVVMDADVFFHPTVLARLIESPFPNALLMDETVTQQTEECMVVVREGRVIALTKQMPERFDLAGEGVGFLKVSKRDARHLIDSVEAYITQGMLDMEYEDALREFFSLVPVGYEKIGGLPWIEIDFPEDITRAEQDILPKLSAVRETLEQQHGCWTR